MNIRRERGLGDLIYIDGQHGRSVKRELDRYVLRMEKMSQIDKMTNPAGLPEYLSDEDPTVVEAAKVKLEELSP